VWLPVSTQVSMALVLVFQKRMQRSAVPPPLASRPCWWGDQAIALTAAVCSVKSVQTGSLVSQAPQAFTFTV
jgi:hypothetical protein